MTFESAEFHDKELFFEPDDLLLLVDFFYLNMAVDFFRFDQQPINSLMNIERSIVEISPLFVVDEKK